MGKMLHLLSLHCVVTVSNFSRLCLKLYSRQPHVTDLSVNVRVGRNVSFYVDYLVNFLKYNSLHVLFNSRWGHGW